MLTTGAGGVGNRKYVTGGDGLQPAVHAAQQQVSGIIEAFEIPRELTAGKPHSDLAAEASRAIKPIGADAAEARAAIPLIEAFHHAMRQHRE